MVSLLTTVISISLFIYKANSAPQLPEINDQFEPQETTASKPLEENIIIIEDITVANDSHRRTEIQPTTTFMKRLYNVVVTPFKNIISVPKVSIVLKNIGTCIVNGAMEIVSYYFPAPLIPLIASAAGLVIPFEPVVLLRERMPVTSYRRAFSSAMNTFLSTFDKFKVDEEADPYMTRRFNRRFMGAEKEDEDNDFKL